jgi:Ca2+-binding EF-hand superfamily protein
MQAVGPGSPVAIQQLFTTLDPNKKGYLSEANVASNHFLAGHFQLCDSNHDGRLTSAEVSLCMQSAPPGEQ